MEAASLPPTANERTPGVVLITGTMAAGKSTVAELLAKRFPRAVHVRGDLFRRSIVSGRVELTPDMPAEALRQLMLRYRLATSVADTYAAEGFVAVVQDIIIGPVLAEVVDLVRTRPAYVVVLDPEPAVVEAREVRREKSGYGARWSATELVSQLRTTTPRIGLWVDTSNQQPAETVDTILDRLQEARVR